MFGVTLTKHIEIYPMENEYFHELYTFLEKTLVLSLYKQIRL
jgi:hypothetical protein